MPGIRLIALLAALEQRVMGKIIKAVHVIAIMRCLLDFSIMAVFCKYFSVWLRES